VVTLLARWYRAALVALSGGMVIGAAGGFGLLFVPPEKRQAVKSRLSKLISVPFKFEFSGSQIIFFDQEADYSAEEKTRAFHVIQPFQELINDSNSRH
jgi:D-glycero-alpha-D-manno-heptose-7-phosphate kinase